MADADEIRAARRELGRRLAASREAAGLTQHQLAPLIYFVRSTVANIEVGRQTASRTFWERCDSVLRADGKLLAMFETLRALERASGRRGPGLDVVDRATPYDSSDTTKAAARWTPAVAAGVASDPVDRRTLVTLGLSAAVASLAGVADPDGRVGQVGAADVERLERSVLRLRRLGHLYGGEGLWPAAADLAASGHYLLEQGTYRQSVAESLQRTIGKAQMCAGWLAFDAGRQDIARSCFNEALSLARQVDDPIVETHALVNLSFQSNILGMPRQALRFAGAADRTAQKTGTVTKMSIVPQLRRAVAHSTMRGMNESRDALADAFRLLERTSPEAPTAWADFICVEELNGVAGTCELRLGDTKSAERLLVLAIDGLSDGFKRNRALYRVRLAAARLSHGEYEGAAIAGLAALKDLTGDIGSFIVSRELQDVASKLSAHRNVPSVEAFLQECASAPINLH